MRLVTIACVLSLFSLSCGSDAEGFLSDDPDAGSVAQVDAQNSSAPDAGSPGPDAAAATHYDAAPQLSGTFVLALKLDTLPKPVLFLATMGTKLRLDALNATTGELAPAAWEIDPGNPMMIPGMIIPAEASPTGSSFEMRNVQLSGWVCGSMRGDVVSPIMSIANGTWGTSPVGADVQISCP